MKSNIQRPLGLLLVCLVTVMIVQPVKAAIIWTFNESGGDVIAVASGTFVESYVSGSSASSPGESFGGDTGLYAISGTYNSTGSPVGAATTTSLQVGGNSVLGAFGHVTDTLFWDAAYGTTLSAGTAVSAQVTWQSTTIDSLFSSDSNFDSTGDTLLAWTSSANPEDTISYVHTTTVPEPSGLMMLSVAGLTLIQRRKRK